MLPDYGGFEGGALDEALEQDSRGPQLDSQVRHRENHGDDDGQHSHPVAAVVVAEHLPGGYVPVAFSEQPLALEKDHPGKGYRYRVEGGEGIGKSDAVDRSGMADESPAAEGGGGGGEDEYPQPDAAAGYEVVAGGAGLAGALPAPEDAIRPVAENEEQQPTELFHGSAAGINSEGPPAKGIDRRPKLQGVPGTRH